MDTTPSKVPSKSRSFSDPANNPNPTSLAPSPTLREKLSRQSKDDNTIPDDNAAPTTPKTVRRSAFHGRGLSLQMPPKLDMPSPSQFPRPAPLSPQLDQHNIYKQQSQSLSASPATSLPRHSRGLDFARACTNLHHTIRAESSPDSSPVIMQRPMMIPGRRGSISSMMLDSPNINGPSSVPWGLIAPERSALSSSMGSVNMLGSESDTGDSDEDASMAGDDNEDPIFTTPQVHKLQNPNNADTPFPAPTTPDPANVLAGSSYFSPAQASLMKTIRRSRLHKNTRRSRKSSSSASGSGYSSMNSPRPKSPPPMRSIESANDGYFNWTATAARSRRESLALGTDRLHLSSGNDSGDEASNNTTPSTPGVVRRPVTRRQNLLPKTKGFARIRAALAEEAAPVESEVRREAETIRQVRERDGSLEDLDLSSDRPQAVTAPSSPYLLPAVPESAQEDFGRDFEADGVPRSSAMRKALGLGVNFAAHASRNSGGMDYWNRFDPAAMRTPPPNLNRHSSSAISDFNLESDTPPILRRPRAMSSASDASEALAPSSSAGTLQQPVFNDDMHLKKFKRRREDDFDIATIKRRAVSPGMSAQNSPVLTQSPVLRDWGAPPERKDKNQPSTSVDSSQTMGSQGTPGSQPPSRHGSGGSSVSMASGATATMGNGVSGGKKLGLQGMVDTNDGLMKMSIE